MSHELDVKGAAKADGSTRGKNCQLAQLSYRLERRRRIRTAIRAYRAVPRDYKASNPSRSSMLRRFFSPVVAYPAALALRHWSLSTVRFKVHEGTP